MSFYGDASDRTDYNEAARALVREDVRFHTITGLINDWEAGNVREWAYYVRNTLKPGSTVTLEINSPGGSVPCLMGVIDVLEVLKKDYTLRTVVIVEACSAAAVIAAFGTKGERYIFPRSVMMLHQLSEWVFGKHEDIKESTRISDLYNGEVIKILADATGKPEDKIRDDIRTDKWLFGKEAIEYGLVDWIAE